MNAERDLYRPKSTQEFVDSMAQHRQNVGVYIENRLPPDLANLVIQARQKTRDVMSLKPEDFAVIFGEQTYGLNERPKVLGKRIIAKALEKHHGTASIELFATYDSVGSEPAIYRMQLPTPQTDEGYVPINILSGWKRGKNCTTASFRSPTEEEIKKIRHTLDSLYRSHRAGELTDFVTKSYNAFPASYAEAQVDLLRRFEQQIGLEIERYVTEDAIDIKIAQSGGMEIMLHLWPLLVEKAKQNVVKGVRVPDRNEAPFYLYHHTEDGHIARMQAEFVGNEEEKVEMDTQIKAVSMQTNHTEFTTPQEIIESGRKITWRAIPRVIMYSTVGLAEGHITGGGSVYDLTATMASREIGLPFFPIMWMAKTNGNGDKRALFNYESYVTSKGGDFNPARIEAAKVFVREGKAAMADLVLSIGVNNLRVAIERAINNGITTSSEIIIDENNQKLKQPVIFNK